MTRPLSIEQCIALACFFEATAPKPGNVHRGSDFEDLTYPALVTSGIVIAPILAARTAGVGATILAAVRATREAVGTNSNLGMVLLLAPLAAVPREQHLPEGVAVVLEKLDHGDAELVYEAIRLARPGGMGTVPQDDVSGDAPDSLLAAMRGAADRDLIAGNTPRDFATCSTSSCRRSRQA